MSKQWILVVAVLVGLAVGSAALVWYGPEVEPVAVGAKAPDYRAVDLASGDSVAIRAHYRGHVTLVNIWATWCGPCKEEMPSMQLLYDSLRSAGFRIAAVSIDRDDADAVKSFASDLKLSFDILQDRSGEIQQAYQTTGVPESFLLDTNGVIMKRVIGAHNWASPANQALVRRLMGAPAGGHVSPTADAAPADSVPATGR
jgi:thiol-disulfide isomerase/thioredoxin